MAYCCWQGHPRKRRDSQRRSFRRVRCRERVRTDCAEKRMAGPGDVVFGLSLVRSRRHHHFSCRRAGALFGHRVFALPPCRICQFIRPSHYGIGRAGDIASYRRASATSVILVDVPAFPAARYFYAQRQALAAVLNSASHAVVEQYPRRGVDGRGGAGVIQCGLCAGKPLGARVF